MSVFFLWVHGEWIVARNKQIAREPLRGSRDLFVPRYDSYPHEPRKKDTHSLIIQMYTDIYETPSRHLVIIWKNYTKSSVMKTFFQTDESNEGSTIKHSKTTSKNGEGFFLP